MYPFTKAMVVAWAFFLSGLAVESSWAGNLKDYSPQAFEMAKKDGAPSLLVFHADWCPTCRKQTSAVEQALGSAEFDGIHAFKVDYDREKDLKHSLKIRGQSTIVVFNGDKEVGRERGITDPKEISALIRKAQDAPKGP